VEYESGLETEIGSPTSVTVRLAGQYDVTVVGAHDRYEQTKPGLGPVASRIVQHAPSAVLVARELIAERSFRILVGVDGSFASKYALRFLLSYFDVTSAEVTLIHVVETPWIHLGLDREWFGYPNDEDDRANSEFQFERELRVEAKAVTEYARRRLGNYGISAATVVEEGEPALEILSEAEKGEYDLIVLGATGTADLKHNMLGSVSTRVAQHAPARSWSPSLLNDLASPSFNPV